MSRIRLGEAGTAVERSLEAAVAALGLQGSAVAYQRIAAGITNLNWLVFDGEQTLFVKLFGQGTSAFIDRDSATQASRLAGELGVGPRLIAYLPEQGAEVFEYLDGYRTMTSEEMLAPASRTALLNAYRRMHEAGRISFTRTGFDQLDERVRLVREIGAPVPRDLDQLLWLCGRARDAVVAAGMPLGVCHNDSYAANFMIGRDGDVRVIDWEYAANNDPAWDLGMIAMSQFGANGAAQMVEEYRGRASPPDAARVLLYSAVVCVSWGLWAALQTKLSTIPFDFRSYSKLLFQIGRNRLRDPAWEAALWQL